jgi:hypothetical protein
MNYKNDNIPVIHQQLAEKISPFVQGVAKEIVAIPSYVRITYKTSISIFIWPRKDNKVLVDIEGIKALTEFKEYSELHWGQPDSINTNKSDGRTLHFWLLDLDLFCSTIKNVLTRSLGEIDNKLFISQINEIQSLPLLSFEKTALVKQRIGHSRFANEVKKSANKCCEVNPIIKQNLIASHIKPWAESIDDEKVDVNNGICLSPNFDGLFEKGLISFDSNGNILLQSLSNDEVSAYGLTGEESISVTDKKRIYLQWHYENKFLSIKVAKR